MVRVGVGDARAGRPLVSVDRLGLALDGPRYEVVPRGAARVENTLQAHIAFTPTGGGHIGAESDGPGLGARFTFTLTTVADAGSAARSGSAPVPARAARRGRGATGDRVRVLAVDDDPQDLRYVRDTLSRPGYDPFVTGDPGEALRLMAEARPKLVLLDMMLAGTDRIELMQAMLDVADVPVIFLSAYGRDELIAGALNLGAAVTWSSSSRRRSWRRGSRRPCAGGRSPNRRGRTCGATWPSTSPSAG